MKSIVPSLLLALLLCSCSIQAQTVDVVTFEKEISHPAEIQLLDVRTPEEFQTGHLKNAMLANWSDKSEFARRTDALDKDKTVYIYCLSGGRSAAAAKSLRGKGFSKVVEMEGGINAWKQAGKPLEGQEKAAQISEASYEAMLQSSSVTLVDFGASWCPPCRKMEPVIQEIAKENASKMTLVKIDGGSQDDLMKSKQIKQMPTFIIYENGKEVWRKSGLMEKEELVKALNAEY